MQGPTTALREPYLNDVTVFDVNTHTWHTPEVQGARPPVRDSHAAVALGDRMVIYGGDCGKEYLNDVWAYHVEQQRWQAFKVLPCSCVYVWLSAEHHSAVCVGTGVAVCVRRRAAGHAHCFAAVLLKS